MMIPELAEYSNHCHSPLSRSGLTYLFWIAINANGLLFSASAGIIINHMVRMFIFADLMQIRIKR